MTDKARKALERQKARLLEQAEAIDRDLAELDRITEKYNLVVSTRKGSPRQAGIQPKKQRRSKGTVASLIATYKSHKDSGYKKVKYGTRLNYNSLLRQIETHCGPEKLAELQPEDIQRFYQDWTKAGEAAASSRVRMLRLLLGFGATVLGDPDCGRLAIPFVQRKMRVKMPRRRTQRLTAEQARAISAKAHELGHPMLALAQAFQFDCKLRQRQVIGMWVPQQEQTPPTDIINPRTGRKWTGGLRWSEIDENLILRHGNKPINLRKAPMVMNEFERLGGRQASGPIIVNPNTGLPYRPQRFSKLWREVADAAGVPKDVFNMDSRSDTDEEPRGYDKMMESALKRD